jgi:predicted aminopeptidase
MLMGAAPIDRVLDRGRVDVPEWEFKLSSVGSIRAFAAEVGLEPGSSYTTVNLGFEHEVHVVTASDAVRFAAHTWSFPVVGRVPYKGFFEAVDAERQAAALAAEGLDVSVRKAGAYSTLGWFRDPILPSMLRSSAPYFVNTLLHESAHATLYLPGRSDFNESWASFVGDRAELMFYEHDPQVFPGAAELSARQRSDSERHRAFLLALYDELDALYRQELDPQETLTRKSRIVERALRRHAALPYSEPAWKELYSNRPLNNAVILSARRYGRGMEDFQTAFEGCGKSLKAFIKASKSLKKSDEDPWDILPSLCAADGP